MSLRESDIPQQARTDREYRPETESDRLHAALKKEINEMDLLLARARQKFIRIQELALATLK